MAKIKKAEWLDKFSAYVGDDTSEEAIALIEDVTDSWDDEEKEDWEAKYHELDESWKKKYRDRFFDGEPGGKTPTGEDIGGGTNNEKEEEEILTYEDFYKSIEIE